MNAQRKGNIWFLMIIVMSLTVITLLCFVACPNINRTARDINQKNENCSKLCYPKTHIKCVMDKGKLIALCRDGEEYSAVVK